MTTGDDYRVKAAELRARARWETDPAIGAELEGLARAYLRLADQAERNSLIDLSYETPPRKDEGESGREP